MIHTGEYTQQVQIAADGQLMARKTAKPTVTRPFEESPAMFSNIFNHTVRVRIKPLPWKMQFCCYISARPTLL